MTRLGRFARSSIGAKQLVAASGVALLAFAILHMIGHLQVFGGAALYNAYADFLQRAWPVKWPVRIGLIAALTVHVAFAIRLADRHRAARPIPYVRFVAMSSTTAGRAMRATGALVLAFLVFHVAHFTLGAIQPDTFVARDAHGRHDAFAMYVRAFRTPWLLVAYVVATATLALHLGHGAVRWLASLGVGGLGPRADRAGRVIAAVLACGYLAPPLAIAFGWIDLPTG